MQMILEKEFINELSLLSLKSDTDADLELFLKEDFTGYHLLCDISSTEEYGQLCKQNPFFELLLDKFISISFDINLKSNIKNESIFAKSAKRTIFFTCLDSDNSLKLSEKYGHMIISLQDISKSWEFAQKFREGVQMKVTKSILIKESGRFDKWSKLTLFSHPFKNLLVFDKYLLKTHTRSDLFTNVIPLISNLLKSENPQYEILITIISEIKIGFALQQYTDQLSRHFHKNIKFNIIRHSKALYPKS